MAYLNEELNCWIDQRGKTRHVPSGHHYADRRPGECIRVSLPEGRRTALGLEVFHGASWYAWREAKRIVQIARKLGIGIVAEIDGKYIECWPHDRPTELNKALTPKEF